jgi:hypothetical protein
MSFSIYVDGHSSVCVLTTKNNQKKSNTLRYVPEINPVNVNNNVVLQTTMPPGSLEAVNYIPTTKKTQTHTQWRHIALRTSN